jgi:hypothetical protein
MNEMLHFVSKAPLPVVYREACDALARCERLDECKSWSDRAMALASYARQAKDQVLFNAALRIQVRAVDRAGALLKLFDGRGRPLENKDGTDPLLSQEQAGEKAGMSERQIKTAVRVNNVPRDELETLVESEHPATVTQLAELGRRRRERAPDPFGPAWADWVFAVKHLRELPDCGLLVLAQRQELPADRLVADAHAALRNLKTWIETLEALDVEIE